MTNFEMIKNMSVEELAKQLFEPITVCGYCPARNVCKQLELSNCQRAFEQWLKSEVEE